jgi:diketogulonate reductase-like aldo/keto reductase
MKKINKLSDTFKLSNNVEIPCIGFGTWQTPDGEIGKRSVLDAIECGYTHIDTAAIYGNEKSVGDAIKESGVNPRELFITTKLWNDSHDYHACKKAFAESMERLDLDVLDLYLIHWPNPVAIRDRFEETNKATWQAMEELYEEGKVRAIGVSNYMPHHLEYLLSVARIKPMVNQIRIFPGSIPQKTIDYCLENDILVQAYSPFGTGSLLGAKALQNIADRYDTTIARLCVRWSLQRGFNPLPKSITTERIIANIDVFGFEISDEDMEILNNIENFGDEWGDPDKTDF